MAKIELFALDIANSSVKLARGNMETLVYPNRLKRVTQRATKVEASSQEDAMVYGEKTKEGRMVNYIIGAGDGLSSASTDVSRYSSAQFKREVLAAITQTVSNGAEVFIVTGVPVTHEVEESRKALNENLIGEHTTYRNGHELTFTITNVLVMHQPMGSFYRFVTEKKRKSKNFSLKDQRTLVLDIGWGTTDIVNLEGTTTIGADGADYAMSKLYTELYDTIVGEYGTKIVGVKDAITLEQALRNQPKKKILTIDGEKVDVTDYYEEIREQLFEDLESVINSMGVDLRFMHNIIYSGGGALALKDLIENKYKKDSRLIIMPDAQKANVLGYFELGQRRVAKLKGGK